VIAFVKRLEGLEGLAMTEESLFVAVLDQAPTARPRFLREACGNNLELMQRMLVLLAAHDRAPGTRHLAVGAPRSNTVMTGAAPDTGLGGGRAGTVLAGRYKLLEPIGEGGMGTVWLAEQTHPIRRQVAVKLIKPGMDSQTVLARFEAERRALALMDHPHIARVLDGDTTAGEFDGVGPGRPFFVMEYIQGIPITQYCDEARLSIAQRLALFVPVCQALQHAHQKGIIHRDLKPSNILVCLSNGQPIPKVIDFGLAKALHEPLTEHSLHTAHGAMLGTPLYMSPEQADFANLDVDTRTDIYALGVILYELLTGTTPLEKQRLGEAAWPEIQRLIQEEEPPRPSVRLGGSGPLASVAAKRQLEPGKLTRLVRGELDWIVMKALEKERSRRYQTADGLAQDLQRYLADEVVEARPPSAGYRLCKFIRRNKGRVLAAALVLLALVGAIIGTTLGLLEARRQERLALAEVAEKERARASEAEQRQLAQTNEHKATEARIRAEQEKRIADAVRSFLQNDLLRQADARAQADSLRLAGAETQAVENPTIQELLDRAAEQLTAERIDAKFPDQPLVQADILRTVGDTYRGVGAYTKAIAHLQRAADLKRLHLEPDHPDTLNILNNLALAYRGGGKTTEAIALLEQVRNASVARLGPDHSETLTTLHNLAGAYLDAGKTTEAIALYEQVRDARVTRLGPDHPNTLTTLDNLALAYQAAGKKAKAIALFENVRDVQLTQLGPNHPDTLTTLNNLARAYLDAEQAAEAITLYERVRDAKATKLGPDHPHTLTTLHDLAGAYWATGKTAEAIALFEKVRAAKVAKLGPDHPNTLATLNNLALAYRASGKTTEAIALFEQVRDALVNRLGPDHPNTLTTLHNLAVAYRAAGKTTEAIALFEKVRETEATKLGRNHPDTSITLHNLAEAYLDAGQREHAVPLFEEILRQQTRILGADHPTTFLTAIHLAVTYRDAQRWPEARRAIDEWLPRIRARLGSLHPTTQLAAEIAATVYEGSGQFARAAELWTELLPVVRKNYPTRDPRLAIALASLGLSLLKAGNPADAEPVLRECLTLRMKNDPDAWTTFHTRSLLGGSLQGQRLYVNAEPLLRQGYEGLLQRQDKIPPQGKVYLGEALDRLIQLYDQTGNQDKAKEWRKKREEASTVEGIPARP